MLDEKLVASWIKISSHIKENKILKGVSYNEAVILNILYKQYQTDCIGYVSMKEVVQTTKMHKSLVNRTIKDLLAKGLVERRTSDADHRIVLIRIPEDRIEDYLQIHQNTLEYANSIIDILGTTKTETFVEICDEIEKKLGENNEDLDTY